MHWEQMQENIKRRCLLRKWNDFKHLLETTHKFLDSVLFWKYCCQKRQENLAMFYFVCIKSFSFAKLLTQKHRKISQRFPQFLEPNCQVFRKFIVIKLYHNRRFV